MHLFPNRILLFFLFLIILNQSTNAACDSVGCYSRAGGNHTDSDGFVHCHMCSCERLCNMTSKNRVVYDCHVSLDECQIVLQPEVILVVALAIFLILVSLCVVVCYPCKRCCGCLKELFARVSLCFPDGWCSICGTTDENQPKRTLFPLTVVVEKPHSPANKLSKKVAASNRGSSSSSSHVYVERGTAKTAKFWMEEEVKIDDW